MQDGFIEVFISMLVTVGLVTAALMVCRAMFRWGNKGRPKRLRREMRAHAKEVTAPRKGQGDDKASLFKSMARISGVGGARWGADKHAQATLEAHEMRRRRKLRVRELCGWARVGVGWLFNFVLYFICCLFTITTCMLKGRVWTQVWMMSVVSANGLTWGLVEPLECLIVVSLPFLFDNKYVGWLRTKLKDLGFY